MDTSKWAFEEPTPEDILATEAWLDQEHALLMDRIQSHKPECNCIDCLEFNMLFYK